MKLSDRIARLEAAGLLRGRDLELVLRQIARAEAKLPNIARQPRRPRETGSEKDS